MKALDGIEVSRELTGKYLAIATTEDGDKSVRLLTATDIINAVDMSDCYEVDFDVYNIIASSEGIKLRRIVVHGCWHNFDDPLLIRATYEDTGETAFYGYGTDH